MKFKELHIYWALLVVFSAVPLIFTYPRVDLSVDATLAVGSIDLLITILILKKLNFKFAMALPLFALFIVSQIEFLQYLLMFFAWSINGFAP